jgi:hypothetical protein
VPVTERHPSELSDSALTPIADEIEEISRMLYRLRMKVEQEG